MGEVYAAVTDEILVNMARHFKYMTEGNAPSGAWEYQTIKLAEMGQVNQETEAIILKHLGDADGALRYVLEESIRDGLKNAEPALRKAAEKGFTRKASVPELAPNQMQAFRAFYNQSSDKLNLVNTVMLDSTQQAYQATVSDIVGRMQRTQGILNTETGEVVTGVTSMNKAVRQGVRKMVDNGITGFIDHGGHHWSPEAYVTMDIRTTMANTAREAVFERQEEYGSELFQVSHHDGARPLCYPWQGKVISRDGFSGEVEDDEGNAVHVTPLEETSYGEPAGLFGINCGHYPIPFFPGFSRIRPPDQDEEANAKEYKESQQQRALERDLRNEKRELAVMKAQGAPEDEIKAQKQRVSNARDNLDAFCDKTGRARRSGREGTPINATFPDGYKQTYYERGIKRRNPFTKSEQPVQDAVSQATQQTQGIQRQKDAPQFTPATTRAEAESYARDHFASRVNYNGSMSLDAMNTVNHELLDLTTEYPIDKLNNIDQNGRMSAIARANGGTLEINGKLIDAEPTGTYAARQAYARRRIEYYQDKFPYGIPSYLQKDVAKYEEILKFSRWGVEDGMPTEKRVRANVAHEYGHIIADQYTGQINRGHFCKTYFEQDTVAKRELITATYKKAKQNGDIYKLSEYGATNDHEFFAETFAAAWMNEPLPDYFLEMIRGVCNG